MLKRPITYTDFNDEEITEEFYFNISKTELISLESKRKGGFSAWIKEIVKIEDTQILMQEFESFILMSYGQKSADGKHFVKTPESLANFKASAAYDALFWELFSDETKMADFISAIVPKEAQAAARQEIENQKTSLEVTPVTPITQSTSAPIPPQI